MMQPMIHTAQCTGPTRRVSVDAFWAGAAVVETGIHGGGCRAPEQRPAETTCASFSVVDSLGRVVDKGGSGTVRRRGESRRLAGVFVERK